MEPALALRLEKIESALAHLDHQYEQLNEMVIAQDKLLARLQKVAERVDGALQALALEQTRAGNTRPPHYQ